MNKIQQITKGVGTLLTENSPHILTGLGCAGVVSTAILTGQAVPKAIDILEEAPKYREPPTTWEMAKLTWKCFIPAGIMGVSSIACIIGANTVNMKRNAALAALYSISETALRDYKTQVVKQLGKTKEVKIRDGIAQDTIIENPVDNRTIIITGGGDVLCYDVLCDRYFYSSYETIRQKVNDLNYELLNDMWLDLNDLYYALGLPNTKLGDMMGFDIEKGKIEIVFSTQIATNGRPCIVIDTQVYPKYS